MQEETSALMDTVMRLPVRSGRCYRASRTEGNSMGLTLSLGQSPFDKIDLPHILYTHDSPTHTDGWRAE